MSNYRSQISAKAFTLIETLVAISILVVAIIAPLSLAAQSLSSAYYARDQIAAFYLGQEAIEAVRSIRDANILKTAYGTPTDLLADIPIGQDFRIDTRTNAITVCASDPGGVCIPLQTPTSGATFFGYQSGWQNTRFTRTVKAEWVNDANHDEMRLSVTVSWQTGTIKKRSFTIKQDLYRWVNDGSASQ